MTMRMRETISVSSSERYRQGRLALLTRTRYLRRVMPVPSILREWSRGARSGAAWCGVLLMLTLPAGPLPAQTARTRSTSERAVGLLSLRRSSQVGDLSGGPAEIRRRNPSPKSVAEVHPSE